MKIKQDQQTPYHRQIRMLLTAVAIILTINLMNFARDFLLPVTLGFFIAITFRPIVRRLAVRGVPASATAASFAALILVTGFCGAYFLSGPISTWVADAPNVQQKFIGKILAIRGPFSKVSEITEQIKNVASPNSQQAQVPEVIVKEGPLPVLFRIAGYPAANIIILLGALVFSLFLMASGNLLYEKLLRLMPTLTDKKNALRLVYEIEHEISSYLLTLTGINVGVGLAVASGFYFLGLQTPVLWACVAFALNFIPFAGPSIGIAISAIVSIVAFDSFGYAFMPPIFYTLVVIVEGQFVSPHVLSRTLQLNAIAILLSIAFWGWLWGILGIAVAVPLLVTLRVFCNHFEPLFSLGEIIGESNPNLENRNSVAEGEQVKEIKN